uniref:Uncharacterized protein n=1 Tax=Nelumbo nucifera TaxID=4432 RepID=A0A823A0Y1_NELNU|nr:TPA_asm: hypothetical protein HUJ06_017765 [Nelumbo nucifera]
MGEECKKKEDQKSWVEKKGDEGAQVVGDVSGDLKWGRACISSGGLNMAKPKLSTEWVEDYKRKGYYWKTPIRAFRKKMGGTSKLQEEDWVVISRFEGAKKILEVLRSSRQRHEEADKTRDQSEEGTQEKARKGKGL